MFKKYIVVVKAAVKKSFVVVEKVEVAVAVKVAVVLLYILFKLITIVEVYLELILSNESLYKIDK